MTTCFPSPSKCEAIKLKYAGEESKTCQQLSSTLPLAKQGLGTCYIILKESKGRLDPALERQCIG